MDEEKKPAEAGEPQMVDLASLDVYSLLGLFVGILAEKAWLTLGLRTKTGTDKVEMNLDQARVAIDTLGFFAEKLQPHLPDDEKRRVEGLVADLRLNYVRLAKT